MATTSTARRHAGTLKSLSWPERLAKVDAGLADQFDSALHRSAISDLQAGRNIHFEPPADTTFADIVHGLADGCRATLTDALVLLGEPSAPITTGAEAVLCLLTNRHEVQAAATRWIAGAGMNTFRAVVNGRPGIGLLMLAVAWDRPTDDPDLLVKLTHRLRPSSARRAA